MRTARWRLRRAAFFVFLSGLGGCENPGAPEPVLLRIEPTKALYIPTDTVSVAMRNIGPAFLMFSSCTATLQRRNGRQWVIVPPIGNAGIDCPDTMRGQLPASTTSFVPVGVIPVGLQPGTYRYRMEAIATEDGSVLPLAARLSAPFLVAAQ